MPELPEVESIRRSLEPVIKGRRVRQVIVRERRLRRPVPSGLAKRLVGRVFSDIRRRAKYLLFEVDAGTLLVHLGMSGSLQFVDAAMPCKAHDHVDIVLDNGGCLRYRDPRRFGCVLWIGGPPERHRLLADIGPEPLSDDFDGQYLRTRLYRRRAPIKSLLMDARIVAGIGNIYANEALFIAGISPFRAGGRISKARLDRLVDAIREVLRAAIEAGGTTLRDHALADGSSGAYIERLGVYGRKGAPCSRCGALIAMRIIAQRSSYHCRRCQR
ncbi:bifunctional DNA-formamidopyrimidine glycosylase/DNA-(apurinic or apyrimidinic site) lyase [Thioalkalivibrio sp. HK1]|uniref:bifunctional DNA-formamidopyrimidine glycosylase/DNA-(apurinic or apyrimidinic site) lyase n=1 Tax=Thioalkalivibrio sp. HK1 TaxID=1469245 RepID=UPI00046FEDBD|nr:bifunctional DNA-formamidopyrimidine glycosylase/DNA-(apurinic or apyrimidinic site) lyase [Thioalkalivibrio sp. HK1]